MSDLELQTTATIPASTSIEITIYEDIDGDGSFENSNSQLIDDGTNTYTVSGFEATSGNDVWFKASFDTSDESTTATLDSVSISLAVSAPTTPQNLTSTVSGDDITLDWDAVNWNGDQDHYNVYRAQASGTTRSDYTDIADVPAGTTSYTDSALEDGERYYYRVDAENTAGSSGLSNETAETTALPAPTLDSLDNSTEDQITVNWTKNDDSGDGNFEIFRSQTVGDLGSSIATVGTATTSYTDTGLEDGEQYSYTVRRNTNHTSSDSNQESAVTFLPAPTLDNVDNSVEDELTVSWTKNDDSSDGQWLLYRSQDGSSWGGAIATFSDLTVTSYTDTGLEDGERYYYFVRRDTPHTNADSGSDSAVTILPSPSGVSLDTSTEDQITVSWTNNDDSSDGSIDVLRSQDGSTGSQVASFTDLTTTSFTDTSLEDGERYYYTIRRSSDHTNSFSGQQSGITVLPAPSSLSVSANNEDELHLSWTNNDDSSDGSIKVFRSQDGSLGSQVASFTTLTTTSYTDTSLEDGERYYYTIRRETDHTSSDSNQDNAITILPAGTLSISDQRITEIDLTWTKNDDSTDGEWEIFRSQDGTLGTKIADALSTGTTSYTDSGLNDGTKYYYTLRRLTDHTSADAQEDAITDKLIVSLVGNRDTPQTKGDKKKFITSVTSTVGSTFNMPILLQLSTMGVIRQIRRRISVFRTVIFGQVELFDFRVNSLVQVVVGGVDDELVNVPIIPQTEFMGVRNLLRKITYTSLKSLFATKDIYTTFVEGFRTVVEGIGVSERTNFTPLQAITEAFGGIELGRNMSMTKPRKSVVGSVDDGVINLSKFRSEVVGAERATIYNVLKTQEEVVSLVDEELSTRIRKVALEVVSRLQKK